MVSRRSTCAKIFKRGIFTEQFFQKIQKSDKIQVSVEAAVDELAKITYIKFWPDNHNTPYQTDASNQMNAESNEQEDVCFKFLEFIVIIVVEFSHQTKKI